MLLIHTADWHLDSALDSVYPPEIAGMRRKETLEAFLSIVDFAEMNGVRAILIAGDLSDTGKLSAATLTAVRRAVLSHPAIEFYYLRGNHDAESISEMPENFHFFEKDAFTGYDLGENVTLYGCESPSENAVRAFTPDPDRLNIVMLHGAAVNSGYGEDRVVLPAFREKPVRYLALGHYHSYKELSIGTGKTAVYAGTPEGRGFDEAGTKGFVLLTAENGEIHAEFKPFCKREIHIVTPKIPDSSTLAEAEDAVRAAIAELPMKDIVRLVLPHGVLSAKMAEEILRDRFFYSEYVFDDVAPLDDPVLYRDDISLRGEFVRLVENAGLPEEETREILRYGLAALRGEEVAE